MPVNGPFNADLKFQCAGREQRVGCYQGYLVGANQEQFPGRNDVLLGTGQMR